MKLFAACLFAISLLSYSFLGQKTKNPPTQIRLVPVNATPAPGTILVAISLPKEGETVSGNPMWIQTRLEGFALGADSQFSRADEVANSTMGQTLHVIIDNDPYFAINAPSITPFDEEGYYYTAYYKFEVPFRVKDGFHFLRIFPARSFGESVKSENAFQATYFNVGNGNNPRPPFDLSKPYLTYNEPGSEMTLTEQQPILLDFYLNNAELSSDGYKVRLSIDGRVISTITSWQPYYIYGLKQGNHTVRLELLDAKGSLLSGPFNDTKRTITVQ